jgi:hypothetical protein
MTLERAGHWGDRRDWEIIVRTILEHTAPKSSWRTMIAAPAA